MLRGKGGVFRGYRCRRLHAPRARVEALRALTRRLVMYLTPCAQCTFALATYGRYDAAFGIGQPVLCRKCAEHDKEEDWRPVPLDAHLPIVQEALVLLHRTRGE
jgi:hypothetical protein